MNDKVGAGGGWPDGEPPTDSTSGTVVGRSADRARADQWALVLASQGISSAIVPTDQGWAVAVSARDGPSAQQTLHAYTVENIDSVAPGPAIHAAWPAVSMAAGLVMAVVVAHLVLEGASPDVIAAARGDAEAVRTGELWRTITALGIHADLGHLLSNALAGLFFFSLVALAIGPGMGALLIVLSGAGGNLLNAWVHGGSHYSIGASTAVFGAVGILTGLRVAGVGASRRIPLWIPLMAGAALLALLGSSETSDVLAHLFGFVAGILVTLPAAKIPFSRPESQVLAGASAIALVLGSWWLALQ